jgi:signal transduction histidine kinase
MWSPFAGARFAPVVRLRHEAVIDQAVPAVVGAAIVVGELLHGGHSASVLSMALGLGAAASLCGRHRWPALALVASGALVALLVHVDRSAGTVAVLAPAVALYTLALRRNRRAQLLGGLGAVGAVLVADLLHSGRPGFLQTAGHVLLVAIPMLAAEAIRNHRATMRLLTERLELADRAREQEAERHVEQERMRIARELHDVVAHTLTEINVQAAAAAELTTPGRGRDALEAIERSSHSALGELRAILGILRDPDHPSAPRNPVPGFENIAELIARTRQSGLEVRIEQTGSRPERISDASSLAAYRIVQESLTNARRHAPGAPVHVRLSFNHTALSLEVENALGATSNGNGQGGGVGIAGMRERASAIGGTLQAGSVTGGFLVQAELPYQPQR